MSSDVETFFAEKFLTARKHVVCYSTGRYVSCLTMHCQGKNEVSREESMRHCSLFVVKNVPPIDRRSQVMILKKPINTVMKSTIDTSWHTRWQTIVKKVNRLLWRIFLVTQCFHVRIFGVLQEVMREILKTLAPDWIGGLHFLSEHCLRMPPIVKN